MKGIPFSVNDTEVSGKDIFGRLVPMEAHEASSLYSEKKAQMLRQLGELVEVHDQKLAEFMSSLQLDFLTQVNLYIINIENKTLNLKYSLDAPGNRFDTRPTRSCC